MEFHKSTVIRAPHQRVWDFLWDIEQMIECIPGCQSATTVEPEKNYQAEVVQKVGPFRVQFPLDIAIREKQAPHHLVAVASGRDSRVESSVNVELDLHLKEKTSQETELSFTANVNLLGKLVTLGHGLIQRKTDEIMTQFANALKERLEGGGEGDAVEAV
ncbi:MAG: CoxG family protein [Candidatus Bipolaricaulia bacterium]